MRTRGGLSGFGRGTSASEDRKGQVIDVKNSVIGSSSLVTRHFPELHWDSCLLKISPGSGK